MPPLPHAPGFPPVCPDWCPFDGWVVMAGLMAYALSATTLLLALALLISFRGRRASWRHLAPLLLVCLCALIAVLCVRRLLQLDPRYVLGDLHYTPALAALWDKLLAERFALMVGPLSLLAFAYATGVSLAIATLVRSALRAHTSSRLEQSS